MIKAAVRRQQQKMAGVMAVIALGVRRRVKLGFTDGEHAVVAFAAAPEHFSMIHRVGGGKSQALGTMTGRAHIAGSNVGRRLTRNVAESVAMAVHAVRRQPIVKGTGFRWHGRHDQLNGALAGDPLSADHQLGDVGATGISNEAGVLKGCEDDVSDLLPSSVAVSPTRTVTTGPVLATTLAIPSVAAACARAAGPARVFSSLLPAPPPHSRRRIAPARQQTGARPMCDADLVADFVADVAADFVRGQSAPMSKAKQ